MGGYQPGKPFLDHYLPAVLTPRLYHPDGQQRDEVFIWGSWLQSKMHRQGVTCSDCHDPHTQKLRAEGNAVCAPCHAAVKYDAPAHHHHGAGSSGALCANCHVPKSTYMGIDGRADHSMRVPRPDQSVALGVPNACSVCHTDRDVPWAASALQGWLGRNAAGFQDFADVFRAADSGRPKAQAGLAAVALAAGQSPIARASALARLAAAGAGETAAAARQLAANVEPLLRLAAAQAASACHPSKAPRGRPRPRNSWPSRSTTPIAPRRMSHWAVSRRAWAAPMKPRPRLPPRSSSTPPSCRPT